MATVGRNVKRRSRIRPIARQHPFDVNVCTKDHIDTGDALFCNNTLIRTDDKEGLFTRVYPIPNDIPNAEQRIVAAVRAGGTDLTAERQKMQDEVTKSFMLIGFAVTDATRNEPGSSRRVMDHLPMTIAGAVTVTRDTLMRLICMSMGETQEQFDIIRAKLREANNQGPGYYVLPAGFMFILHGKVMKLIDTVHVLTQPSDRRRVFQSVSLVVSTLSS